MKPTIMVNQKTPTQIWNRHFISVEKPALVETCEHVHSGSTVFRPTATQLVASEGLWRREMTESRLVSSFKRVPSAPMLLSPLKIITLFLFSSNFRDSYILLDSGNSTIAFPRTLRTEVGF